MTAKPEHTVTGSASCSSQPYKTQQRAAWSHQSFLFLMPGNRMLSYHLLLGESQTIPHLKNMGGNMQLSHQRWSEEVDMLCALVLSHFFLSQWKLVETGFFPPKNSFLCLGTWGLKAVTTNTWRIQGMLKSQSEVWPAKTWWRGGQQQGRSPSIKLKDDC